MSELEQNCSTAQRKNGIARDGLSTGTKGGPPRTSLRSPHTPRDAVQDEMIHCPEIQVPAKKQKKNVCKPVLYSPHRGTQPNPTLSSWVCFHTVPEPQTPKGLRSEGPSGGHGANALLKQRHPELAVRDHVDSTDAEEKPL